MIINMAEQSIWWTMNMLKQSIAHMKAKNTEGQYNEAIEKEISILRSFFDEALGRPGAGAEQAAA